MTSTPINVILDSFLEESIKLSPIGATMLGVPGLDDQLDDLSMAGNEKRADLIRRTLNAIKNETPVNEFDRIARDVAVERLTSELNLNDTFEARILFNLISSPVTSIRQVFEMMKKDQPETISHVTKRLDGIESAFEGWKSTLEFVAAQGKVNSRRQVLATAGQLETFSKGAFSAVAKKFNPAADNQALMGAAQKAERACAALAIWMRDVYAPQCLAADGVGETRYKMWARHFTGADLDLRDTYEWGIKQLEMINERMWIAAKKLYPDATTLREVADRLDSDSRYTVEGEEELLKKLRDFIAAAVERLDGKEFDIDPRIRNCEARLAPEGSASAAYYMGPSEDLTRPGTTWFPTMGRKTFGWWHIVSTWYHEAVPGHHLQVATTKINTERLNRFQRNRVWVSGYGEGWALYAERLMDELGAFADPGYEMGYLSAQGLRAARIVVDIGMHCGYKDFNGEVWNAESAFKLLHERALLDEISARSEVDRYLGWPGQAISYKVGERFWMEAREDAKKRLGAKFELKKFHSFALNLGPMGLDPFKREMALWDGN
ncbi:MAG: DUF885 domain-containing protein [Candidatus Nanopelagicaceae bacterium]|jgi:uncharacterized protein (DUF885 family)|nr:DUF885 domain-containing protein [Candidatus Nanopelagicaceae bacterium]